MQSNSFRQCKVCETKENVCFHYGVITCRACGAFFRRYLENEKKSKYIKCKCLHKQLLLKESKIERTWEKCKSCRLDKCFSVGMKKLDIGYLRKDVCREAMDEQRNEINLPNHPIVDTTIKDLQQINSTLPIIEAKKRIMHAFNDLDDIFLKGPILFEEIISSNFNIFRLTGTFSPNTSPIPFDELKSWKAFLENNGMLNKRWHKNFLVDRLLCVGIARSLPVFEKLTLSDQIAHLRQICHLFISFTNTYLAWELGFETWARKDCVGPAVAIMNNNVFLHDEKMLKWADYSFTKSVVHFKRATLTSVEFALLIAIIFTKSDAEGLSVEGKELLYNESVKYTNILLRYNQQRLGSIEGAQRLDECFRLINRSIENEYTTRLMLSHQLKYYSMDVNHFKNSDILEKLLEKRD
uniref:Uncharacterized protein n=1 Tax=Meloidogyne enterolobii TaxID=390850 RepID=A0A6V7TS25_MELEN|nr:unnamed protein product [Meloidogyne enterolobii]